MAKLIIDRPPPKVRQGCATGVGYNAHLANKERPCEPCRIRNNEKNRRYRESHPADPEKDRVRRARYRSENLEKIKLKDALYYLENKDKLNAYSVMWMRAHPDFTRKHGHIRRARESNAPSEPYTTNQIIDIYGADCHICHEPIDLDAPRSAHVGAGWERGLQIDHVTPLSKGGTDLISNVKPSHARCNLEKRARV